jgi:hypothetical protein
MRRRLSIFALILLMCTLFSTLVGCGLLTPQDKSFSKAGMTITLTSHFSEQDMVTQTAYYVSPKAIVTALKEDGSTVGNYTVKRYAELVCEVNKLTGSTVTAKDGYAEFDYEKEVNGKEYYYYARCFKDGTDYWLFQFACETKNTEECKPLFDKWASSVTFD